MRTLIVEDGESKLVRVRTAVAMAAGAGATIDSVSDVFSALESLRRQRYDLLVLDIALPLRGDGEIVGDAGIQILEHIRTRTASLNVPSHIIGITERDDVFAKAQSLFSARLLSLVYCDLRSADWETALSSRVHHIAQSTPFSSRNYESDIAIVCALQIELDAVLKFLPWNWQQHVVPNDHTLYWRGVVTVNGKAFSAHAACASRMGMPSASALSMKLIHSFRPRLIAMVGIAAGSKSRVELGDLLAADCTWDWGSGKWLTDGHRRTFAPSPRQIPLDLSIRAKLLDIKRRGDAVAKILRDWPSDIGRSKIGFHIGPMATGAAVLADDSTIASLIADNRELIGVDMEAYAVYSAAEESSEPHPKSVCIKAVVDFADGDKKDGWQAFGAYASSVALGFLIEELAGSWS